MSLDEPASTVATPDPDRAPPSEGRERLWSWDQIRFADARVLRPRDARELAALLRELSRGPGERRVSFRGGGQAMDGHSLNDDIVIALDHAAFQHIGEPRCDDAGHHVTVGAGATWGPILAKTADRGLLPYSVPTTSRATLGGTLAADCLSRCSPISGREGSHVRSFKMLTADGTEIECRRDDPDPDRRALFGAAIGGFGYLGAITEATIDLRPPLPGWRPGRRIRVATRVDKSVIGDLIGERWSEFLPGLRERTCDEDVAEGRDGVLDHLLDLAAGPRPERTVAWDAVSSAAWYALGQVEALLFRSRYVLDREVDPMPLYQKQNQLFDLLSRGMTEPSLTEMAEGALFLLYQEGVYVDEIDNFTFFMENQISPARDAATAAGWRLNTVQQTFVLPAIASAEDPAGAARTAAFLRAVRPTLFDEPDAPTFLDRRRPALLDVLYLPADDILLSAGRGGAGYAVTLTFTERDGEGFDVLRSRLRELSRRCAELGGRVHLVKNVEVAPAELGRMYGEAFDAFLALKRRYDPRGMLRNELFERVLIARSMR